MVNFYVPSQATVALTPYRVIGFIVYGFFLLLLLIGWLVEYTPLFGGSGILGKDKEDMTISEQDKALMSEKHLVGKIFIAFSPGRNL